jgi:hypothetical protein
MAATATRTVLDLLDGRIRRGLTRSDQVTTPARPDGHARFHGHKHQAASALPELSGGRSSLRDHKGLSLLMLWTRRKPLMGTAPMRAGREIKKTLNIALVP